MNSMNEMNELEIQLRSWMPRGPSAKVEQRVFAAPSAAAMAADPSPSINHPSPGFRLRWLAPATVGLVLLCVLFNQREGGSVAGATNSGPMVAMILSNHSVAAYLPGNLHREQNGPPTDTFEWTNGSGFTSSIRSLSGPKAQD